MDYDLKNQNLHYKFELFWPNNFLEDFEKYQQNFDSSKLFLFEEGVALHSNTLESPLISALYQVLLKSAQWFWKGR